jgi:hypothetical protein
VRRQAYLGKACKKYCHLIMSLVIMGAKCPQRDGNASGNPVEVPTRNGS